MFSSFLTSLKFGMNTMVADNIQQVKTNSNIEIEKCKCSVKDSQLGEP